MSAFFFTKNIVYLAFSLPCLGKRNEKQVKSIGKHSQLVLSW